MRYLVLIRLFIVVLCPALNLLNGEVNYNHSSIEGNYPVNTTASFSCYSTYILVGNNTSTCDLLGNWQNFNLSCQGNSCQGLFLFNFVHSVNAR